MRPHSPQISVIMSVFNSAAFLKVAIESILIQSFSDFEFIIIDDKSTDGSSDLIQSYSDPRIRIIVNSSNLGLIRSLNKGIQIAQGIYIARMDSDDVSLPARLEQQFSFMEHHPEVAVCGSWVRLIGGRRHDVWKSPIRHDFIKATMLFNSAIFHPTAFIRKTAIQEHPYDLGYFCAEDYELWERLAERYATRNIPKVLLRYRIHHQKMSYHYAYEQIESSMKIVSRQLRRLPLRVSESELRIHTAISFHQYEYLYTVPIKYIFWLAKLFNGNLQAKVYSPLALGVVLLKKLFNTFFQFGAMALKKIIVQTGK